MKISAIILGIAATAVTADGARIHIRTHGAQQHGIPGQEMKGQLINGDKCGQMRQGSDIVLEWKKSWLCAPGHYCDKEGAEWRCRPDVQRNGQDDEEAAKFKDTEACHSKKRHAHKKHHHENETDGESNIICGKRNPNNYQEFWWVNRALCPANKACANEGYVWKCRDDSQPNGRMCGETINDLPHIPETSWYDAGKCDKGYTCHSEGQQYRCRPSGQHKHHAHKKHGVPGQEMKGQLINGDKCGQTRQGSDIVLEWKKSWLCAPGHYCDKEGAEWRCRPDAQRNGQDDEEAAKFKDTEAYHSKKHHAHKKHHASKKHHANHALKKHHYDYVPPRELIGQLINGDKCGQMRQGSDIVLEWKKSWLCASGHFCDKEGAEWRCRPHVQRNGQDDDEAYRFKDTDNYD